MLVPDARAWFTDYLREHARDDSDLFSAEIIFGEVVGNVARHAPGPIAIAMRWKGESAVLEVWDCGPGYALGPFVTDDLAESQRGLFIVAALGHDLRVARDGIQTVTSVGIPVAPRAAVDPSRPFAPYERTIGDEAESAIKLVHAMVALRRPDVVEHMIAVAGFAERISRELALDLRTMKRCIDAARIHDAGLIVLDDAAIGGEPARNGLGGDELTTIGHHPALTEAIAKAAPALSSLSAIVRSHHERIDGTGYPDGLAGDEIPIESRIIAVADALHQMTSPTYTRPMLPHAALHELHRQRDAQFDARVVAACSRMFGYQAASEDQTA